MRKFDESLRLAKFFGNFCVSFLPFARPPRIGFKLELEILQATEILPK